MAKKGTYTYDYPHPAVTADNVIFGYDGVDIYVLLVKRGKEKEASSTAYEGEWALPGGFMDIERDKTVAHTAVRELREETGLSLKPKDVRECGCYSRIDRDPRERVITIAHYALVVMSGVQGDTDAERAEWVKLTEVPSLAFDHDKILRNAFATLRERIHFEPIGFELLPEVFTMPQLQNLYESILDVTFDRRNFAKKMLTTGVLTEYEDGTVRKGTRTPIKYKFDKHQYELYKSKGFRLEF